MAFHTLTNVQMKMFKAVLAMVETNFEHVDALANEKREAMDEKSDNYKESDNGETAETLISNIETVRDSMETLRDALNEIEGIND